MENKPVLWDKGTANVQSAIRLPKSAPDVVLKTENADVVKEADSKKDMNDIVAKSSLKADAPEWFPNNSIMTKKVDNVSHSLQNRLKIHKRNGSDSDHSQNDWGPAVDDIKRLKQIITTLSRDPGQFDNLLDLFMETLVPYFQDLMTLSTVAKILVEEAILDPNFRYTGARLCWHVEQNCPEFRAELPLRCEKHLQDTRNPHNVLLFIAELYAQLPHGAVYGKLLVDSFKRLLALGGDDNVKCICQALKLTGYSLEKSNKNDLDEVFEQLKNIKNAVGGNVTALLNTVINLRYSNWGHSSDSNDSEYEMDNYVYEGVSNTVFYQPDGNVLTNEESEFIASHMHSNEEYASDNSDPDDLCDPEPEMDEEIQAAFKEFVKSSKH
ncbi:unnamed protein product [Callosobruchus maculatus]|uniref:MIF4G domain-containing protein n=1 Tax=Callosobruchus maculatus TaxID=64391 RepID=A0A653DK77_CALMS|nr:unnamed protein product [Callosobruchus maculatus]